MGALVPARRVFEAGADVGHRGAIQGPRPREACPISCDNVALFERPIQAPVVARARAPSPLAEEASQGCALAAASRGERRRRGRDQKVRLCQSPHLHLIAQLVGFHAGLTPPPWLRREESDGRGPRLEREPRQPHTQQSRMRGWTRVCRIWRGDAAFSLSQQVHDGVCAWAGTGGGGGRHQQQQQQRQRAGADGEKSCGRWVFVCQAAAPASADPSPASLPPSVSLFFLTCATPPAMSLSMHKDASRHSYDPFPPPTTPSLPRTMPPSCSASTPSYLLPQQNRPISSIVCLRLPFPTTRGLTTSRAWAARHTRMKHKMAATRCAAMHLLSHSRHHPHSFPLVLPAFPASLVTQPANPAPPPPPDHPHAGSCLRRFRVQSARIRARDRARHERGRGLGPKTCGKIAAR